MRINIVGEGSFGKFLVQELPNFGFELDKFADSVILAVPLSAYEPCGEFYGEHENKHLINVCSVQKPSTDILLKYTDKVTSLHPLFGPRSPANKRNSILTYTCKIDLETQLLKLWYKFSKFKGFINPEGFYSRGMSTNEHDELMAKTHAAAVLSAKQAKHFVDAAADIPDELIPNSFRLLREFVKTLDDMPAGTISSIMSNPYI